MEATGRDGGRGRWSYGRNQQTRSGSATISSSSGTIVSTTYTSSASRMSVSLSVEADMLMELEIHGDENMSGQGQETEEKRWRHIQSLIQEFFAAPSSNCIGDMSVLERWLTELGVGWVFHLANDTDVHASETVTWIWAFTEIMQTINMVFQFREDEHEAWRGTQPSRPDWFRMEQFFLQTLLKMLTFVDVTAKDIITNGDEVLPKLRPLLQVHFTLSNALWELRPRSLVYPLLQKKFMAGHLIWRAVERIMTCDLGPMEDSSGSQTAQPSSDIHKLTRSVAGHITFILDSHFDIETILVDAAKLDRYVPQTRGELLLSNIITEMMTCLEEKLVTMLESFSDQSLMFLFLLNNFDVILESLPSHPLGILHSISKALTRKVNGYVESYLQVSWTPLLSCLFNPTPLCLFGKYHYPLALPKFESDFQKMYTTQRLWKVPDPKRRKSLRTAITEKIVPGYTKYIEDNKVTTPKFTPKVLEEMLEELFEG